MFDFIVSGVGELVVYLVSVVYVFVLFVGLYCFEGYYDCSVLGDVT